MIRRIIKFVLGDAVVYRFRAFRAYFFGEPEIRYLKNVIPKGRPILDIGANVGEYSYWFEKFSKEVICVDAHPTCCEFLERVCRFDTRVLHAAVSDKLGKLDLKVPINQKNQQITARASISDVPLKYLGGGCAVEVESITIDSLNLHDIGFIKIDVEGHELEVLKGAVKSLKKFSPMLQIEVEQRHISYPMEKVFEFLDSLGYAGFFLENQQLVPIEKFSKYLHQERFLVDGHADIVGDIKAYMNNFFFFPK